MLNISSKFNDFREFDNRFSDYRSNNMNLLRNLELDYAGNEIRVKINLENFQ